MTFLILVAIISGIAEQTDWMGGAGVLGPVSNWGTRYYDGASITTATEGQVSLTATSWNYDDWATHVVESNSGIYEADQGLMPADVDGDGILDLVAYTNSQVVWYKHTGSYGFSKNVIGSANSGGDRGCVYPIDLDQDGDIDVLAATQGAGLC